ncbi:hypothetical protein T11_15938 [Trichinella zimbabwensis]|uniref:Uncharacterized protein n=1 Tax=Trichinella zimbabwensis TaxID=268475 RepID=A0A0V1GED5_9BILA|nr:hypothetical protein T11_15938 [Trichinella zimbabwensis]
MDYISALEQIRIAPEHPIVTVISGCIRVLVLSVNYVLFVVIKDLDL